ncbi:MAG TPA: diacylglycerol kinase family protein [Methylomirabilota bacterium]|nr:diacylglycerol kinase family protein [Methylomirabilota bacterium]
MYYYIVDPQKIPQREFERVQNLLYSSVSEYRVSGEVVRVTGLRTINQLVENALSHGAKTIVAVGSDDTLNDVINAVGRREVVIGFVPIFPTEVGKILGIKSIEQAAKTLGGRRIAELDLGLVNKNFFVSKLSFGVYQPAGTGWMKSLDYKFFQNMVNMPSFDVKFSVDGKYQASLKVIGGMIVNSRDNAEGLANPTDGVLDVLLLSKLSKWDVFKFRKEIISGDFEKIPGSSVIHVSRLEISTPVGLPLKSAGRVIAKTPAVIEVMPKALKIIVGKERKF